MAELAVTVPDVDGAPLTKQAAAAGGDHVLRRGADKVLLVIDNASAGAITVTVDDPNTGTPEGATAFNPDVAVSVAAGTEVAVLLDAGRFADADDRIDLTYSGVTSLTVAAVRLY